MNLVNPRIILTNYLAQSVIKEAELGNFEPMNQVKHLNKRLLNYVMGVINRG